MVGEQGSVTGVNIISPQAPGGLGLCAHGCEVVNIFHLLGGESHLQTNSGNVHQIPLSRYFREEISRIYGGRPVLGRPQRVLLAYKVKLGGGRTGTKAPQCFIMAPSKPELQLPICAQTITRYTMEEGSTLKKQISGWTWM